MEIKPLLTEEQQKELDMIRGMSHEELNEWASKLPICEGKSAMDYAQYVDMTPDEFAKTYDLIDITNRILSCGNTIRELYTCWQ